MIQNSPDHIARHLFIHSLRSTLRFCFVDGCHLRANENV